MPLAVVVPWYSEAPSGGAERYAGALVRHLNRCGYPTELLTTCSRDPFHDWGSDWFPAGAQDVGGVPVRRFPVRRRNARLFAGLNQKLITGSVLTQAEERLWEHHNINSDALLEYIRGVGDNYAFLFTPYLYGTTLAGSRVRPDRSFLIPCLHDEPYAFLHSVRQLFHNVRATLFLSEPERALAERVTGVPGDRCHVVGGGSEPGVSGEPERARQHWGLRSPYLVYVGRKVPGKNLSFLLDSFRILKKRYPGELKLVLAGHGTLANCALWAPKHPDIMDLGPVDEQAKFDLLAGAVALCQPSLMESLSLVLVESWLVGTPVIVHRDGQVTSHHCRQSAGGFAVGSAQEFEAAVQQLLAAPEQGLAMGESGRRYAMREFDWDRAVARIAAVLKQAGIGV